MSATKKRLASTPDAVSTPPRKRKPKTPKADAVATAVDVYDFHDSEEEEPLNGLASFATPIAFKNSPTVAVTTSFPDPKKVCGKCCELGDSPEEMKVCTGICRRSFHLSCYPRAEGEVASSWQCPECSSDQHPCFICNKYTEDVRKCSDQTCFRHYHRECMTKHYPHKDLRESDEFICPLHFCLTCHIDNQVDHVHRNVKRKLVQCLKCPTAYHILDDCIAAGAVVVSPNKFIICPEHRIRKKRDKQINVNFCYNCTQGGQLICCERCPAAFHQKCLEMDDEAELPEHFFCGDCAARKQLLYGDIIWAKLGTYRWWPGKIVDPKDCPKNVMQLRDWDVGQFPVYFFGSHDYNWLDQGRVFRYEEGDAKKGFVASEKRMDKKFTQGLEEVTEALKEYNKARINSVKNKDTRPTRWVHIRVNKPYGKVRVPRSETRHASVCGCKEDQEKPCSTEQCVNRAMMIECNDSICRAKEKCCNQRIKKRKEPPLEYFNTCTRGWGLRSKEDIKKGEFVVEYVGELINEEECKLRLKQKTIDKDRNFYFSTLDKDLIIDAGPKGNMARFMNHSCDPNCETQKWEVDGYTKVGLFANRDIPAGTELTFNYNLDVYGNQKTECQCGADNCSKFIGVRPSRETRRNATNGTNGVTNGSAKKKRKVSTARLFANEHDDECFFCGLGGELIMCDKRSCPKSYHLDCCQLEAIPRGKWQCPHHHCDECGSAAVQFCAFCPCSYCYMHQRPNFKEVDGQHQCPHHEEIADEPRPEPIGSETDSPVKEPPVSPTKEPAPETTEEKLAEKENSKTEQAAEPIIDDA